MQNQPSRDKEKHSESEESSPHSKRRKLSTPRSKLVEPPHWSSELSSVAEASDSSQMSGFKEISDFTDMDHDSPNRSGERAFIRVNNPDPLSSPDAGAIRDKKDETFQLEEELDISFSQMEPDIEVSNVPDVGAIEAEVHGDFGDAENDDDEEDHCPPNFRD